MVLVAIEIGYLAIANVLLWSGAIAHLVSSDPDAITLEYERPWTLWFGRVHLKRLSLRGSSNMLEWSVEARDAVLDIRLRDLFVRRFHASRLRGEDMVFRLRLRLTREEAERPAARALPPIRGYDDPPLVEIGPPEPDDDDYHLWTTQLEDVDVGVREIWIEHYRFVGDGRTRGGFFMKPQRVLKVPPSTVTVRSGALTLADKTLALNMEGTVDCTLAPLDPRTVSGLDAFSSVTGRVLLDAQIPSLEGLSFYLPPASDVALIDGSGELRTDLFIRQGLIEPKSRAVFATKHFAVASPDLGATMEGEIFLRPSNDTGNTAVTFAVDLPRASIDRPATGTPPARIENLRADIDAPEVDLAHPSAKVSARVDVPAAVIPDLRWLNRANPRGDAPRFVGGAAFFQTRMEMSPSGRAHGRLGVRMIKAAVRWRDTTIEGDGEGKTRVEMADVLVKKATLEKSHAELRDVTIERKGSTRTTWWASVDANRAELGERGIDAALEGHCKDAQPAVELLEAGDVIPAWAATLLKMEDVTLQANIAHRDARLDFELLRARGTRFDVRGRLARPDRGRAEGAFLIRSGPLSVGIGFERGGVQVMPFGDDAWLDGRIAALGAKSSNGALRRQ